MYIFICGDSSIVSESADDHLLVKCKAIHEFNGENTVYTFENVDLNDFIHYIDIILDRKNMFKYSLIELRDINNYLQSDILKDYIAVLSNKTVMANADKIICVEYCRVGGGDFFFNNSKLIAIDEISYVKEWYGPVHFYFVVLNDSVVKFYDNCDDSLRNRMKNVTQSLQTYHLFGNKKIQL